MSIYDAEIRSLDGEPADLGEYKDEALLIVNVASRCGLTPQYEGLVALHEQFRERGLTVLGVPCNQFMGQEPGSSEEIATFCATNYGVAFPMTEKVDVNGPERHALYEQLVMTPDNDDGHIGDVRWNFEKFLVAPGGEVVARYAPQVEPQADEVVKTIESHLPR